MNRFSSWPSALALAALFGCSANANSGVPPQAFAPAPLAKSSAIAVTYTELHVRGNGPIAFGPAGATYVDLASLCFNYENYAPCTHSIARVSANGRESVIGDLWCRKYNGQKSCDVAAALLAPSDGSLWIARDDGVLLRVPPGRFSASAMLQLPSSYGRVVAMAADSAGHVWIASFNKKGRFELFATTVHAPQTSARVALPACSINRGVSGRARIRFGQPVRARRRRALDRFVRRLGFVRSRAFELRAVQRLCAARRRDDFRKLCRRDLFAFERQRHDHSGPAARRFDPWPGVDSGFERLSLLYVRGERRPACLPAERRDRSVFERLVLISEPRPRCRLARDFPERHSLRFRILHEGLPRARIRDLKKCDASWLHQLLVFRGKLVVEFLEHGGLRDLRGGRRL